MERMLQINSKIENLRIVEKFVDDLSSQLNLSSEIYGNLLIATLEAANNAIIHGNKGDENKKVEITAERERDALSIRIKDEGNGFDYTNIPDPTAPENLEKDSGRGVFLMTKLSDNIEFDENGRIVKLYFNTNI